MSVRRKSNWYVYFISFGIAMAFAIAAIIAFRWYLFPEDSRPTGMTASDIEEKFKPTAEHNFCSVIMIGDKPSANPELFLLIEFSAVENRIAVVTLPNGISIPTEGRSLPNICAAQGEGKVVSVLENILDLTCDSYIRVDRRGFISLVSILGNVDYDVFKTMIIYDGTEAETLNVGTHRLAAESIFRLAMLAEYPEGESYRFSSIGQMFADLINQNYRTFDQNFMDSFFNAVVDEAQTTDLTKDKYNKYRPALKYTFNYASSSPVEYYVPYGEYTADGGFIINDNSKITIRQRAGLE